MKPAASSQSFHPRSGARFVFEREDGSAGVYGLTVYMPAGRSWSVRAVLTDAEPLGARPDDGVEGWAHDEALKLCRVLRRTPKPRLVRWRGDT